jgi:hypothetical protein
MQKKKKPRRTKLIFYHLYPAPTRCLFIEQARLITNITTTPRNQLFAPLYTRPALKSIRIYSPPGTMKEKEKPRKRKTTTSGYGLKTSA